MALAPWKTEVCFDSFQIYYGEMLYTVRWGKKEKFQEGEIL